MKTQTEMKELQVEEGSRIQLADFDITIEKAQSNGKLFEIFGTGKFKGMTYEIYVNGEAKKEVSCFDYLMENDWEDWEVISQNIDFVVGYKNAAKVLEIPVATTERMDKQGALPAPISTDRKEKNTSKVWHREDLLKIKPLVKLSKRDLLGYISKNLLQYL